MGSPAGGSGEQAEAARGFRLNSDKLREIMVQGLLLNQRNASSFGDVRGAMMKKTLTCLLAAATIAAAIAAAAQFLE